MKAIVLTHDGDQIGGLKVSEIPVPVIKADEVLIRVRAVDINPVDNKTLQGKGQFPNIKADDPIILGWGVAGTIEKTGTSVTAFNIGDEVFGLINFPGHGKAYAEYVAAPASQIALIPDNVDAATAAATTLSALMAYQALRQAAIRAGERVLIQGVAGGVGYFALQIAKQLGTYVIGTAKRADASLLKASGLNELIDYQTTDFERATSQIDFVLDTLGGANVDKAFNILRPQGRLITIPSGAGEDWKALAAERGINARFLFVHSSGEDMAAVAGLLASGVIKPNIAHRYTFDDIIHVHELMSAGKISGKTVVTLH